MHAEIAGAGFAGLVAAIALAERGWSVRVHERTPALRAEGFAIAMQPNMLKVLETLGLGAKVLEGGLLIVRRETRNAANVATMALRGQGTHRVSRQHIVAVLGARAAALGVDLRAESPVAAADPAGVLVLADGTRCPADLVVATDGVYSAVRESLAIPVDRKVHNDGALRLLVSRTADDVADDATLGPMTCEYWSGTRRVITSPCSARELYVAMSSLASDATAHATPIDVSTWSASFPHLAELFARIRTEADWSRVRWVRFETLGLSSWHKGKVAFVGDAAHAMTPNLGQGAGCAMMNALALAVHLENTSSIETGLERWEATERPLTAHTQTWSARYGSLTTWPETARSLAFYALGSIGWLRRRYQRAARHIPTGYRVPKEKFR